MNIFGKFPFTFLLTIVVILNGAGRVKSMVSDIEIQNDTKWNDCILNFTSKTEYKLFQKSIEENRLVKLSFNLSSPINGTRNNSDIVKQRWFIAKELAGKDLLLLDDQFEIMSLGTLSIKVSSASLTLKQTPQDCIAELSESQARETISAYVLQLVVKRHANDEDKENEDEINLIYVCNGTLNENGVCCVLDDINIMSCMKLEENKWTRQFHIIVYILTVFVMSQSIRLIPQSFYKDCEVRMASVKTPIKLDETDVNFTNLKFLKKANNDNDEQSEPEITKRSQDAECNGKTVLFYLQESRFESQSLQNAGFLNILRDLLQIINDIFCKCIYKDREEVRECCYYSIYRSCYCLNCLSWLMNFFLLLIILLPFILRMIFLHNADVEEFYTEIIFLIVGLMDFLFFSLYYSIMILNKKNMHGTCKYIHAHLKECLRLVMAANLQDELTNGLKWVSRGFVYCARKSRHRCLIVMGSLFFIIVVFPLTIIIHLLKCLVVMHPLLHFILRFPLVSLNLNCQNISDFIKFNELENTRTTYCLHALHVLKIILVFVVLTIMYIIFVFAVAALFFFIQIFIQTIVFYITCILYVAIGCLFNFDDLFAYITCFVLILTYMYKCIQNVSLTTRKFKRKIIDAIIECDKKNNYASEICGEIKIVRNNKDNYSNEISGKIIKVGDTSYLQTNHFVFYYKSDTFDKQRYMYVSKAFLERVSSIKSNLTPGPTYWLYCKAFVEIVAMFMLLGLLVIIVVSYGKAIDLPTGLKSIITLGSGALIVFLFDKFFVKSVSHSVHENKQLFAKFIRDQLEIGIDEIWQIQLPDKRNEQTDLEFSFDDRARLRETHNPNTNLRVTGIYYESFENSENTSTKVPF